MRSMTEESSRFCTLKHLFERSGQYSDPGLCCINVDPKLVETPDSVLLAGSLIILGYQTKQRFDRK